MTLALMNMLPQRLGEEGEAYVAKTLMEVGLTVEMGGPADLICQGMPVEVKAARLRIYRSNGDRGYQFCLKREGKTSLRAPVVICLCYYDLERDPVAFVIPAEELGRRWKITIPGSPERYRGRWRRWYRRWDVLADLLNNYAPHRK